MFFYLGVKMPGPAPAAMGKGRAESDHALAPCLHFFSELEGNQVEILRTWRSGAEGVGRGGEGRAGQLPWAVSELPASAGWGGDDFTPQKCLNQENNPTWDAAGKQAV